MVFFSKLLDDVKEAFNAKTKTPKELGYELVLALKVPPKLQDQDHILSLIKKGATLEEKDYHAINPHNFDIWQATPLSWAAHWGQARMVEMLIEQEADVNAQDRQGWTPLMRAARAGHMEIAHLLLSAGAEISFKDHDYSMTAVGHAFAEKHNDIGVYLDNVSKGREPRPTYFQEKREKEFTKRKEEVFGNIEKGVQEKVFVKKFKGFKK